MTFSFTALHPNIISNIIQFCVDEKQSVLFLFDELEKQKNLRLNFTSFQENLLNARRAQYWKVGVCLGKSDTKKCLKSGKPQSLDSNEKVMLVFQNHTNEQFDLHWINYDGGLRHNGKIHPQNSLVLSSFLTHPFLVQNIHGQIYGLYIPIAPCKSHVIHIRNDQKISVTKGSCSGKKLDMKTQYIPHICLGFRIYLEQRVIGKYPSLGKSLRQDIQQILNVCPKPVLKILKSVPIYINKEMWFGDSDCPSRGRGMCYQAEAIHLKQRGLDPAKAKSVEIYRVEDYLSWRKFQPWMIFHEFAHAFHHYIGAYRADVKECYKLAMSSGLYQTVPYILGGKTKHYGASNMHEYFAENSEAYFGKNDYFPFVRSELEKYDPRCFALMEKLWFLDSKHLEEEHIKHQKLKSENLEFDATHDILIR